MDGYSQSCSRFSPLDLGVPDRCEAKSPKLRCCKWCWSLTNNHDTKGRQARAHKPVLPGGSGPGQPSDERTHYFMRSLVEWFTDDHFSIDTKHAKQSCDEHLSSTWCRTINYMRLVHRILQQSQKPCSWDHPRPEKLRGDRIIQSVTRLHQIRNQGITRAQTPAAPNREESTQCATLWHRNVGQAPGDRPPRSLQALLTWE